LSVETKDNVVEFRDEFGCLLEGSGLDAAEAAKNRCWLHGWKVGKSGCWVHGAELAES